MRAGPTQLTTARRILTCAAAGTIAVAGCGDDLGTADAPEAPPTTAATTTTPAPTTTTPPASTTTTLPAAEPPPYSFDGSVPPPELVNTGDDHEAIFRSLNAYGDWLAAHNPDPTLLAEAYVPGTDLYERFQTDLEILAENEWRSIHLDYRSTVSLGTVDDDLVSFRVTEHMTALRVVDTTGVVEEQTRGVPIHSIVILSRDAHGNWRIADFSNVSVGDQAPKVEVSP